MSKRTIRVQRVSDFKIKVPSVRKQEGKVVGSEICDNPYSNVLVVAPKGSGKSVLLTNMALATSLPETKFFVVANTLDSDPCYSFLKQQVLKRGGKFFGFKSLFNSNKLNIIEAFKRYLEREDALTNSGANRLEPEIEQGDCADTMRDDEDYEQEDIIDEFENSEDEEDDERFRLSRIFPELDKEQIEETPEMIRLRNTFISPKWVVILDDLPRKQVRHPVIESFLKQNRHHLLKTFISTQAIKDVSPSMWENADQCVLFKNIPERGLKHAHDELALTIDLPLFLDLYKNATAESYTPLIIDKKPANRFRRGINHEYKISE